MKLIIVSFGNLKLPGARAWADHYAFKLSKRRDFTFEEIELQDGKSLDDWLQKNAPKSRTVHLLDESGENWTSAEWEKNLKLERDQGRSWILAIGPANGWETMKESPYKKISLGAQTLAHDLAKLVLLEQIYRATSMMDGHPYHRA